MKTATLTLLLICTAAFAQQKGTFTDARDKKKYKTVFIGGLTWMAENLSYNAKGSYCPGETEGPKTDCKAYDEFESCLEYKEPTAKQIQDKKKEVQANCAKNGRKYTLETAKTACPTGWHLPTIDEWYNLEKAVGETAGKKLKAKSGWNGNGNGTDEYGFTALPGGSDWWTAKESSNSATYCEITSNDEKLRMIDGYKETPRFVRCVEGKSPEEAIAVAEKAAVENAAGKQFNPKIKYGSMTDARDKAIYKTVKIGEQTWMAENLNYNANGSRCYKDKDYYCKRDGRLYDWETAKTSCPAGWHLPTDGGWKTLENAAGGGSTAGDKLKATSGWIDPDTKKSLNGTDDFGFSALPAGNASLNDGKDFSKSASLVGRWWSASENTNGKIFRNISSEIAQPLRSYNGSKTLLFSVRCLQGEAPKEEPPAPATAPAAAKQAAPAGNPSKPMYCVSSVMNNPVSCLELTDTPADKSVCDKQNGSMKMMMGKAEWTANKPSVKCDKVPKK